MARWAAVAVGYAMTTAIIFALLLRFSSAHVSVVLAVKPDSQPTVTLAQIFWADSGRPFSEQRSVRYRIQSDSKSLSLVVPSSINSIRIDPLDTPGTFELSDLGLTVWGRPVPNSWNGAPLIETAESSPGLTIAAADGVIRGRSTSSDPQITISRLAPIIWWQCAGVSAVVSLFTVVASFLFGVHSRVLAKFSSGRPLRHRVMGALTTVLVILVLEGVALSGLTALGMWPSGSLADEYRVFLSARAESLRWGTHLLRPHPYFGFRLAGQTANNFGFQFAPDLPYQRQSSDFVIGIFGGSVAEAFAFEANRNGLLSDLAQRVPELRNRTIKVINFALPAGRQPQQFFIASYFVEQVDLLLNLDGFNDVEPDRVHASPELPFGYPEIYEASDWDRLWPTATARLTDALAAFAENGTVLKRSALYYALWRLSELGSQQASAALATRLSRGMGRYEATFENDWDRVSEQLVSVWAKYATLEHQVARASKRRAVFFLQPNQYVRPAKPFSEEERRYALGNTRLAEGLESRYQALRSQIPRLREIGLQVFDLTDIFATETRTVYVDSCCHLNLTGNRILADRVIAVLAAELLPVFSTRPR